MNPSRYDRQQFTQDIVKSCTGATQHIIEFHKNKIVCCYYKVIQFGQVDFRPSQYCVKIGCLTSGRARY